MSDSKKIFQVGSSKSLILGGIFGLLYHLVVYVLSILQSIIVFDVLYWPPFMDFTLRTKNFWTWLVLFLIFLDILSILLGFCYKKRSNEPIVRKLVVIVGIHLLLIFPIGTMFGMMILHEVRSSEEKTQAFQENSILNVKIHKETGLIVIFIAIFYLSLILCFYYLTVYLSFVMLDLTYPSLTMTRLIQIRYILLVFTVIPIIEIIIGIMIYKNHLNSKMRIIAKSLAISQLIFIPIGTYYGWFLLEYLKKTKQ